MTLAENGLTDPFVHLRSIFGEPKQIAVVGGPAHILGMGLGAAIDRCGAVIRVNGRAIDAKDYGMVTSLRWVGAELKESDLNNWGFQSLCQCPTIAHENNATLLRENGIAALYYTHHFPFLYQKVFEHLGFSFDKSWKDLKPPTTGTLVLAALRAIFPSAHLIGFGFTIFGSEDRDVTWRTVDHSKRATFYNDNYLNYDMPRGKENDLRIFLRDNVGVHFI